jgi:hypothetical protein
LRLVVVIQSWTRAKERARRLGDTSGSREQARDDSFAPSTSREAAVATGNLIGESIRVGLSVEGVPLRVSKVFRIDAGDESSGQPRTWTFIEFEIPDGEAERLADSFSGALDSALG